MSKEILDKIEELNERLNFLNEFNVKPSKVWINQTNGPTLQQEKTKVKHQLEVLKQLIKNKDE